MAPKVENVVDETDSESDSDSTSGSHSRSDSVVASGKDGSRSRCCRIVCSAGIVSLHRGESFHLRSHSHSPTKSGSESPKSRHSPRSRKSSHASHGSRSKSRTPVGSGRSRSGSAHSNKSGSSNASEKSDTSKKSAKSNALGCQSKEKKKSLSRSSASGGEKSLLPSPDPETQTVKSGCQSPKSGSTSPNSRSQSPHSPKARSSKSRSPSPKSQAKSRFRSKSGSVSPRKSRSRSGSRSSRSKSPEPREDIQDSRSNSPNLMIDDAQSKEKTKSRSRSKSKSKSKSKSRSRSGSKSSAGSEVSAGDKMKGAELSDSESEGEGKVAKRKGSDSGSDTSGKPKKKTKKIIDSDDGGEAKKIETVTADALFGDASDISTDEEAGKRSRSRSGSRSRSRSRSRSQSRARSRSCSKGRSGNERRVSGDDEGRFAKPEEEEPEVPETRIDVDMPKIWTDLGKELHFVKLPNFLSVETRPYDASTYEDEIDEEETLDEEGRARLKLKVENTMRWRTVFDKDGNAVRESNARMVKWSDGSMSLHLGSEIFDVYKQPLHGDHNHLFVRQGTGLQGQAVFRTKLSFRPHSTESFTHRKMTLSLADRSTKTSAIKILSQVGADPDADRKYQLKKEEMELRAAMRSRASTRPKRRSGVAGTARGARAPDDSDDEGGVSLAAIKNKYKQGQKATAGAAIYSSESEGSDLETRRARRLDRAKVLKDSDDEGSDHRQENGDATPQQIGSASGSPSASNSDSGSE